MESYFLASSAVCPRILCSTSLTSATTGVKLQGFINANQKNPALGFARPYANWPTRHHGGAQRVYSNYNALQVKYEQRFVAGLTLLNSFTWEHSLDNASASLEGNTPSPQDVNNLRADYAQSDYNLPLANITSLVYDLPFGHGRQFMGNANPVVNGVLGGWQISAINTAQAGTPFNLTYKPNSASRSRRRSRRDLSRSQRVPAGPGARAPFTQGVGNRAANTGYVNYVNPNAFVLPPIKERARQLPQPVRRSQPQPRPYSAFYQTDLALNKNFNTPIERLKVSSAPSSTTSSITPTISFPRPAPEMSVESSAGRRARPPASMAPAPRCL